MRSGFVIVGFGEIYFHKVTSLNNILIRFINNKSICMTFERPFKLEIFIVTILL